MVRVPDDLYMQVDASWTPDRSIPKPCVAGSNPAGGTHLSPGESGPEQRQRARGLNFPVSRHRLESAAVLHGTHHGLTTASAGRNSVRRGGRRKRSKPGSCRIVASRSSCSAHRDRSARSSKRPLTSANAVKGLIRPSGCVRWSPASTGVRGKYRPKFGIARPVLQSSLHALRAVPLPVGAVAGADEDPVVHSHRPGVHRLRCAAVRQAADTLEHCSALMCPCSSGSRWPSRISLSCPTGQSRSVKNGASAPTTSSTYFSPS
ncbi:hypothetical protein C8E97_0936 [Saccharothrix australiensis]|uniref:Uncharacterized protein n=1 Tax=Saccharothrix australiensis TaxID=2072 RepID=A0A495VSS7_9PSEU|nr:hypothetical protein C8E97_0936 [Saccharothrix australiensis]